MDPLARRGLQTVSGRATRSRYSIPPSTNVFSPSRLSKLPFGNGMEFEVLQVVG
ncbi:hypothetical protein FOWG_14140 [Fusarium oxysporum f. sp. lycopersici MN25]|uniref:Uncharacterized protein n=1 Tax=Fusarium oxysporum Fo47 TaxID=660027 RepID=W9KX46_FUSOX|nr:hypothetical protein FOZG_03252 [Fusarium oxysporum Fo47]EWZ82478.1 hypothetical protein FOWG_14140 [Fusarium oxysporum f. sp. lycopersici MN25]